MPLTDILCCRPAQVFEIITAEDSYQLATWFQAKNIGMIELCQLGDSIGAGTYSELSDGFNLVGEPLPEGPWPQTIPPKFVESLKSIEPSLIPGIADQWSTIEEFHGAAIGSELADYISRLRSFLIDHEGDFFLVNAL